jgi:hypothetical protein
LAEVCGQLDRPAVGHDCHGKEGAWMGLRKKPEDLEPYVKQPTSGMTKHQQRTAAASTQIDVLHAILAEQQRTNELLEQLLAAER